MTTRNRMTWQRQKKASPPPASYGWTPDHPAYYPDPEANKYENGDTSSWAEDPTTGPYPQGPAPASYSWKPTHPAAKPDAGGPIPPPVGPDAGKTAALRARVEQKAAKCIRVASAILGKGASVQAIENKALTLMDLPDRKIDAALIKVRQAFLTGTGPMGEDLDGDGIDQNDPFTYDYSGEMEIPTPPIMAGKHAEEAPVEADEVLDADEAMLAEMLEDAEGADVEAEEMLQTMLAEEGMAPAAGKHGEHAMAGKHGEEAPMAGKYAEMAMKAMSEVKALKAEIAALKAAKHAEEAPVEAEDDPMGLMAEEVVSEEEQILAELFGSKMASKKGTKKSEEEPKKGGKKSEEEPKKGGKKGEEPVAGKKGTKKSEDVESEDVEGEDEGGETGKQAALRQLARLKAQISKLAKAIAADEGTEAEEEEKEEEKPAKEEKAPAESAKEARLRALRRLAKKAEEGVEGEEVESEDVEGEDEAPEPKAGKKAYRSLFADDDGDDDDDDGDDDDAEVEVEETETEETKKEARLRPQARKASVGPRTLGAVRVASTGGNDLSKLWKSAPDVSDHF